MTALFRIGVFALWLMVVVCLYYCITVFRLMAREYVRKSLEQTPPPPPIASAAPVPPQWMTLNLVLQLQAPPPVDVATPAQPNADASDDADSDQDAGPAPTVVATSQEPVDATAALPSQQQPATSPPPVQAAPKGFPAKLLQSSAVPMQQSSNAPQALGTTSTPKM